MTIYDRPAATGRAPSPAMCLTLSLILAISLMLLPASLTRALRSGAHSVLRPGLAAAVAARDAVGGTLTLLGNLGSGTQRAAQLEAELVEARRHAAQLEAEVVWLRSRVEPAVPAESAYLTERARLVQPRLARAEVLGRQAQRYLQSQALLDLSERSGVSAGDLVVEQLPGVVDHGSSAGAVSGQLVLAGRRVWGKLSEVQPHVSLVMRTTDPGFRELVCVVQPHAERLTLGPRAVLRGTGEALCLLEQVPLTQAVAVGQWVVTVGGEGLLDGVFLYGSVERVEQSPGAAHWDIWVRPAIDDELPRHVCVLTATTSVANRDGQGATR